MKKLIIFLACLATFVTSVCGEVRYKVKRIIPPDDDNDRRESFSSAWRINNNGVIIGGTLFQHPTQPWQVEKDFVYVIGGTPVELSVPWMDGTYLIDINDSGQILCIAYKTPSNNGVSRAYGDYDSKLWEAYLYTPGQSFKYLGVATDDSDPCDLNNLGEAVGSVRYGGENGVLRPVVYNYNSSAKILDVPLEITGALCINDTGLMVLYGIDEHSYLYDGTNLVDIGEGEISEINNHGVAVGCLYVYGAPYCDSYAVAYSNGTYRVIHFEEGWYTDAVAINNYGVILVQGLSIGTSGYSGIWCESEGFTDLNRCIVSEEGEQTQFILLHANDINDRGQIVGQGYFYDKDRSYPVLLEPIPPKLEIRQSGTNLVLSWTPDWPGLFIEKSDSLISINWVKASEPGTNVVVLPKPDKQQFYRLNIEAGRGLFWGP